METKYIKNHPMLPDPQEVTRILSMALAEDIGCGDVTTAAVISDKTMARMALVARQSGVICGMDIVRRMFAMLDETLCVEDNVREGDRVAKGTPLMRVRGAARAILTGERVALNIIQRLSGIATLTSRYVAAVQHTKAQILDTRKTTPGLRVLEKYAVAVGGGRNHRMRLDDGILIKDNHIALCGGLREAVRRGKSQAPPGMTVAVECDTLAQVEEALKTEVQRILLDNMALPVMRKAVRLVAHRTELEASGGVTLLNAAAIAETGVDYISVGALTHSAAAIDIGMDRAS